MRSSKSDPASRTRPAASCPLRFALLPTGVAALLLPGPARAAEGLELVPEIEILAVLLLLFVAIVFPVNRLIFKPIFAVLDAREARIAGTRDRAERLARESDRMVGRCNEALRGVRAEAAEARKQTVDGARGEGASRLAAARADAEQEIERGRSAVGSAVAEARSSLRAQAENLAQEAATRVLGRPVS